MSTNGEKFGGNYRTMSERNRPMHYRGGGRRGGGWVRGGGINRGGAPRFRRSSEEEVFDANGVPVVPVLKPNDALHFPFPRLRAKSRNNTWTLDEELLRAVIGLYGTKGCSSLPIDLIQNYMESEHPHLMECLYHSTEHLKAYLLCYGEHFRNNVNPTLPNDIWYTSASKIVAKTDRRRYEKEIRDGGIRLPTKVPFISDWDDTEYVPHLEKRAIAAVIAIFHQKKQEYDLPMRFLDAVLRNAHSTIPDVCGYMGSSPENFIRKRLHFFGIFGDQTCVRNGDYVSALRALTQYLKNVRGRCDTKQLFQVFLENFGDSGRQIDQSGPIKYENFMTFLSGHKFLFRLDNMKQSAELRYDVVPDVTKRDIDSIPKFDDLDEIYVEECAGFGGGFGASNASASYDDNDVSRWVETTCGADEAPAACEEDDDDDYEDERGPNDYDALFSDGRSPKSVATAARGNFSAAQNRGRGGQSNPRGQLNARAVPLTNGLPNGHSAALAQSQEAPKVLICRQNFRARPPKATVRIMRGPIPRPLPRCGVTQNNSQPRITNGGMWDDIEDEIDVA